MRRHFSSSLLILISLAQTLGAQMGASAPPTRIARFASDRPAAISYTFDDNSRDQYTLAVPMLNEVGFKGTFFVIAGKTVETPEEGEQRKDDKDAHKFWGGISWPELKGMAADGHEIASHTWSHLGLTNLKPAEVEAEISKAFEAIKTRIGRPPLTLAFPGNRSNPEVQAIALKYHVAFRAFQQSTKGDSTTASLNGWADKLVRDKDWGVLMTHGIEKGYAAMTSREVLHGHFTYVKSRERDIWVATFADVSRYSKERDNAKVSSQRDGDGVITCSLTGTLNSAVFDVPLTIVVEVPGATSAHATRSGHELPARVVNGSIQVDAAPDKLPIRITWH